MTTMSLQPRLNTGTPQGVHPSPAVRTQGTDVARTRSSILKPIALDCADLLRIRNGRGTRVSVASGVLWVTEENGSTDRVLLPGDAIDLVQKGTAIAIAHRPARIVIEVPPSVAPPRVVEMVLAGSERARRIALAVPTSISLSTIAMRIAAIVESALIWRT